MRWPEGRRLALCLAWAPSSLSTVTPRALPASQVSALSSVNASVLHRLLQWITVQRGLEKERVLSVLWLWRHANKGDVVLRVSLVWC
jgi:hypothetical protein